MCCIRLLSEHQLHIHVQQVVRHIRAFHDVHRCYACSIFHSSTCDLLFKTKSAYLCVPSNNLSIMTFYPVEHLFSDNIVVLLFSVTHNSFLDRIWYGGVWQIGVFPYSAYHTELSSHSRRRGSDSFSPWAVITHIGRSSKPKPTSLQASNTADIVSLIPKTSWILHEHFRFITREEEKMMNETVISKTNCRNG